MSSLGDALRYPTEHDDWMKTILIGGVLSIFGFLLIPIIPVYGYIVRVLKRRLAGEKRPPTFDDWGELFGDGVRVLVIGIVYMLVPAIVGAVTVGGSILAMATETRGGVATGMAGLAFGFLLTFVLSLVFGYVAVAAIVTFAREDRLGAAFDFGTLRTVVFEGDYAVAWLLSIGVFIGAGVVTSVLNVVPVLGAIVGAFVVFYAQIVAANLWADGYSAALEAGGSGDQTEIGKSAI